MAFFPVFWTPPAMVWGGLKGLYGGVHIGLTCGAEPPQYLTGHIRPIALYRAIEPLWLKRPCSPISDRRQEHPKVRIGSLQSLYEAP